MRLLLALPLGILLPAATGWMVLALLQRKRRVLFVFEQAVFGWVAGVTFTMFLMFAAHAFAGVPLNAAGFLGMQLMSIAALFGLHRLLKPERTPAPRPVNDAVPRWITWTLALLCAWITLRAIVLGVTFLLLTPTFLDDTLDNWNLRGKVFFHDQALTLVMPTEDPETSPLGVSSYPPTVPLVKTMFAAFAGEWNEPLANIVHLFWYLAALALFYAALRHRTSRTWALLGTYALGSIPLYQMHGTNPYGDLFMSLHVFLPISQLFLALTSRDTDDRMAHFSLGAFAAGLLAFTKNEGLLVFLPPLLLILAVGCWHQWRTKTLPPKNIAMILLQYAAWIAAIALPWLIFKWMNGLTFGNAKPIGDLGFGWQDQVPVAITVNTFFEGNWHLLFPLLIALLLWQWRQALTSLLPLTAFFLMVYLGQMFLFLFTGLAAEAIRQTGYARGIVQLLPSIVLLFSLLLANAFHSNSAAVNAVATNEK